MAASRARRSRQKQTADKNKARKRTARKEKKEGNTTSEDVEDCNTPSTSTGSKATYYRQQISVKKGMPESPKMYAEVVAALVETATPRMKTELSARGIRAGLNFDGKGKAICTATKGETHR